MRALMKKASASKFFQKTDKKEIIMSKQEKILKLEEKQISNQLGIDNSEIDKHKWLFDMIKYTPLPLKYTRIVEGDEDTGKIKYLNSETGLLLTNSPLLGLFKKTFYEKVDHAKAAHIFDQKSRKLLPFMEDKLSRERIGLASKRKQAERVNLVRDQKGKVTTSKTERIVPDTKKMMISRDYLLKMIVDKVITKSQLYGRGKRAKQFSMILQKNKKQKEVKNKDVQISQLPIEKIEEIYNQSIQFYREKFGTLQKIPQQISLSKSFLNLTPQCVAKCISILGIQKQRVEEYWFGKIMSCLPLPANWIQRKVLSQQATYLFEPLNVVTSLHPSISYLIQQINTFRNKFSQMDQRQKQPYYQDRQMTFTDFFERPYKVDMYLLLSKNQPRQQIQSPPEQYKKINDWLILEGVTVCNIQPNHYHLSQTIEDYFIQTLDGTEVWHPEVNSFGEVIWTNTITTICVSNCPVHKQLKGEIQTISKQIPQFQQKDYNSLFKFIQENWFTKNVFSKIINEKSRFLQSYIKNQAYYYENKYIGQQQLLFFCPFQFLDVFGQDLPIWVQKTINKTYKKFVKMAMQDISCPQNTETLMELIYRYLVIIKQNKNWETYFKQVLPSLQSNRGGLQILFDRVFNFQERLEWLKTQNKNNPQKTSQQLKLKYLQAHKLNFKQPEVIKNRQEQQNKDLNKNKNQDNVKQGQQSRLAKNKKYFDMDSQYNYDKANQIMNVIKEWSQAEQDQQLKSRQIKKRIFNDEPMILQTDEQQLDQQLRILRKKINRSKKFQSGNIHTKNLEKVNQKLDDYQRIVYKNGLLKSNLKDESAAMNRKLKQKFLKRQGLERSIAQTSNIEKDDNSISIFNSICSDYSNTSIDKIIKNIKKKETKEPQLQQSLGDSPLESKSLPKQSVFSTSIEYPSIFPFLKKKDPNFIHVDLAKTDDFKMVFFRQKSSSVLPSKEQSKHRNHKSTDNLKKLSKPIHQRSASRLQKVDNAQSPTKIKIRCLDHACSHLLNTNVITSRSSFDRLQIRKQLYSKNRGLKLINI